MQKPFIFCFRICLIASLFISCNNKDKNSQYIALENHLDSFFNAATNHGEIPAAVAFIEKSGKHLYHKSFGFRNLSDSIPLKKDDIFRMASMTKGLTALAILQLVEAGKLSIEDEVSKYLPEFEIMQVLDEVHEDTSYSSMPAIKKITIRHLLTHTSGIGYGFQNEKYNALVIKNEISEGFEDDDRNSRENIRRIAGLPLLSEPGEKYIYGLSYDILGVIIEEITGLRFDRYIKKNILDSLNMNNSYFIIPPSKQDRLVKAYEPTDTGFIPTTYPDTAYPVIQSRRYFSGGADLCSTAEDYAMFVRMVMQGGQYKSKRILGEKYAAMMLNKQTELGEEDSYQGFGTWITNRSGADKGPMNEGAFGFGGFWDTYSWADPKEDLVAVLLLQLYPTNRHQIHEKFQEIVYSHIQ